MNYTKEQIAAACATYGPQLNLPAEIDGAQLLWAISGQESSFGANCTPRHEPAFDAGGMYSRTQPMPRLLEKFGSAAACSYGPWQIMLANAADTSPEVLLSDLDAAAKATVAFINSFVLGHRQAKTVEQIAETYNSGHISLNPAPGVLKYLTNVAHTYSTVALPPVEKIA